MSPAVGTFSDVPEPSRTADTDTPASKLSNLLDTAFRIQFSNGGNFPDQFIADVASTVDEDAARQVFARVGTVKDRCHISRVHLAFLLAVASRRGWTFQP